MGRLGSLCLGDMVIEGSDSIEISNLLFDFVLQSCPNLRDFKFNISDTRARGYINLDFRRNHHLQHIELGMRQSRYYTFHHEFGKIWSDISNQMKRSKEFSQELDNNSYYFVNLAWDTTKHIDLQLSVY